MVQNDRRAFLKRCFGTSCGFSATLLLSPALSRRAYGRESYGEKTEKTIVPGHGSVQKAHSPSAKSYRSLLAEIEKHARESQARGISSDQAAQELQLSESLGDYRYFRNGFHEIAMAAWYRELSE